MTPRRIGAGVVGLIAAVMVIMMVQAINVKLYPLPAGLDPKNPEAMKEFVKTLPTGAFLMVLLSYAAGSFAGGAVSALVARRLTVGPAIVIGVILTGLGAMNLAAIPHPLWFAIVSTALYVPLAYLGARLLKKPVVVT